MRTIFTRLAAAAGCFVLMIACGCNNNDGAAPAPAKGKPAPTATPNAPAATPSGAAADDEAFAKAKAELTAKCDEYAKVLTGADFTKTGAELTAATKAANDVKDKFVAEARGGKDEDKLAKLNLEYSLELTRIIQLSQKLLGSMKKPQEDVESALLQVALSRPQATEDEIQAVQKIISDRLEKASSNLDPLRQASSLVVPVTRATAAGVRARTQNGENVTDQMQSEEHVKGCRKVLDDLASQPGKK